MVGTTSASRLASSGASAAAAAKPKATPTPTPNPTPTPAPSPTPNSDNRTVYFGDETGNGSFVPSIVTAGNVFEFTLTARNDGANRLTHAEIGYGSLAIARQGSNASLPAGMSIAFANLDGVDCMIAPEGLGALCDAGQLDAGETVHAQFIVNAPSVAPVKTTYASFKVAENVPDQGANRNTFFADGTIEVGATNTNGNATFKLGNEPLTLSTLGQTLVKKDSMTTTVSAGVNGGAISISEADCTTADPCNAGQIATVHVRDGAPLALVWTLVIVGTLPSPLVVTHTLDDDVTNVPISESCSETLVTNCIESVVKNGNVNTIIFRTPTNGRIRV